MSVPPTVPEGEVVERTLEWERAERFEEATGLAGIAEFRDAYWVAGDHRGGLAVWTSDESPSEHWAHRVPNRPDPGMVRPRRRGGGR